MNYSPASASACTGSISSRKKLLELEDDRNRNGFPSVIPSKGEPRSGKLDESDPEDVHCDDAASGNFLENAVRFCFGRTERRHTGNKPCLLEIP